MASTWEPTSTLAHAVVAAGFRYDPAQDIIYSKHDAWQRGLGYTWAYDVAAPGLHMIIDCEPFYFVHAGKLWMIELWKGQYGLETGAEIGVYRDDLGVGREPRNPRSRFYVCVGQADQLQMRFTLHRKGEALLRRGLESHWWLTGFHWGIFTQSTRDLSMDIEIVFPSKAMRDAFGQAVRDKRYVTAQKDAFSIGFTFDSPRTPQPGARLALEAHMQKSNQRLVAAYTLLKKAQGIETNDPNEFTQLDEPAGKVVQAIADASNKARDVHAAAKKKIGSGSAVAKKLQQRAAAGARKLQRDASAAVRRLQDEADDDIDAAYQGLATFYERKVWHVTHAS